MIYEKFIKKHSTSIQHTKRIQLTTTRSVHRVFLVCVVWAWFPRVKQTTSERRTAEAGLSAG